MLYKKYPNRRIRHFLSSPFIYMMIVPMVTMDVFLEIYHHVCFSLYKIPLLKRSEYIKFDRYRLKYLSLSEKINCSYCGYANGLAHYFSAIAAATELYWCGIKHEKDQDFHEPTHHDNFVEYGDEEGFHKKYDPQKP